MRTIMVLLLLVAVAVLVSGCDLLCLLFGVCY